MLERMQALHTSALGEVRPSFSPAQQCGMCCRCLQHVCLPQGPLQSVLCSVCLARWSSASACQRGCGPLIPLTLTTRASLQSFASMLRVSCAACLEPPGLEQAVLACAKRHAGLA